jgi:hypothetical protein
LTTDTNAKFCSLTADTEVVNSPSTSDVKLSYTWLQQSFDSLWTTRDTVIDIKVSNADANVTRYNNGVKLIRHPGLQGDSLEAVYRTYWGAVYHARKLDLPNSGWATDFVSDGDAASIARDYNGGLWVTERVQNGEGIHVQYCAPNQGTTWNDFPIGTYNPPTYAQVGAPSIAAAQYDSTGQNNVAAYVTYTIYNTTTSTSYLILVKINAMGQIIETDTLDNDALGNDSFPTVGIRQGDELSMAWSKAGAVYYMASTAAVEPGSRTKISWSAACNLTSTANAACFHPAIMVDNDTVIVAFAEGSTPRVLALCQTAGSAYNSWGDTFDISSAPDTGCDWPTISRSDSTVVVYQKTADSLHSDVWATINFVNPNADWKVNVTGGVEPCEYGQVAFEMQYDTIPVILCVSTGKLTPNEYEMAFWRYDLTVYGGGGVQSASIFNPNIKPQLLTPRPNPFRQTTSISYAINRAGATTLKVYDLAGRTVRTLVSSSQKPGSYNASWDRTDDRAQKVSAGIYFVRLSSPSCKQTRKVVVE